MDSLKKIPLSGHIKLQVAMIARTKEKYIRIERPPCKQQRNSIDCAVFAIANATEFCYSGRTDFIDFDQSKLRSHWLECLQKNHISPFPRLQSRPKKTREEVDVTDVNVYCICRLPDNYGNVMDCDKCGNWYHCSCVGKPNDFSGDWICNICQP